MRGATALSGMAGGMMMFQSTRPVRGATIESKLVKL